MPGPSFPIGRMAKDGPPGISAAYLLNAQVVLIVPGRPANCLCVTKAMKIELGADKNSISANNFLRGLDT